MIPKENSDQPELGGATKPDRSVISRSHTINGVEHLQAHSQTLHTQGVHLSEQKQELQTLKAENVLIRSEMTRLAVSRQEMRSDHLTAVSSLSRQLEVVTSELSLLSSKMATLEAGLVSHSAPASDTKAMSVEVCDGSTSHPVKAHEDMTEKPIEAPDEFLDPLTSDFMEDPVILPSSHITIDRPTIVRHLRSDPHDPFNHTPLAVQFLIPNDSLKAAAQAWKQSYLDAQKEEDEAFLAVRGDAGSRTLAMAEDAVNDTMEQLKLQLAAASLTLEKALRVFNVVLARAELEAEKLRDQVEDGGPSSSRKGSQLDQLTNIKSSLGQKVYGFNNLVDHINNLSGQVVKTQRDEGYFVNSLCDETVWTGVKQNFMKKLVAVSAADQRSPEAKGQCDGGLIEHTHSDHLNGGAYDAEHSANASCSGCETNQERIDELVDTTEALREELKMAKADGKATANHLEAAVKQLAGDSTLAYATTKDLDAKIVALSDRFERYVGREKDTNNTPGAEVVRGPTDGRVDLIAEFDQPTNQEDEDAQLAAALVASCEDPATTAQAGHTSGGSTQVGTPGAEYFPITRANHAFEDPIRYARRAHFLEATATGAQLRPTASAFTPAAHNGQAAGSRDDDNDDSESDSDDTYTDTEDEAEPAGSHGGFPAGFLRAFTPNVLATSAWQAQTPATYEAYLAQQLAASQSHSAEKAAREAEKVARVQEREAEKREKELEKAARIREREAEKREKELEKAVRIREREAEKRERELEKAADLREKELDRAARMRERQVDEMARLQAGMARRREQGEPKVPGAFNYSFW